MPISINSFLETVLVKSNSEQPDKRQLTATPVDQPPPFHYLWVNLINNSDGRRPVTKEKNNQEVEPSSAKYKLKRRLKRQN